MSTAAPALGSWWNLIFLLPFGLGALLCVLSLPMLGRRSSRVHRPPAHASRVAVGRGARPGVKAGTKARHARGARESLPPILWAQCGLLWWGACGYGANLLLGAGRPHAASFALAALGAVALSLGCARALAKLAPPPPRAVAASDALEGLLGEASAPVSDLGGWAYVRDGHGGLHHVACFCGEGEAIGRGEPLVTLAWDGTRQAYKVRAWRLD